METTWAARDLAWSLIAANPHPVGLIYCAPREHAGECVFPSGSKILEIVELLVHPDHRSRGYGLQLVTAARERARLDGFSHLRVYSAAKRFDDMVRFYRRCGFAPWYVELVEPI